MKHPEKVKQLILVDSAGIRPNNIQSIIKRTVFKTLAKTDKKILLSSLRTLLYKDAVTMHRLIANSNLFTVNARHSPMFTNALS